MSAAPELDNSKGLIRALRHKSRRRIVFFAVVALACVLAVSVSEFILPQRKIRRLVSSLAPPSRLRAWLMEREFIEYQLPDVDAVAAQLSKFDQSVVVPVLVDEFKSGTIERSMFVTIFAHKLPLSSYVINGILECLKHDNAEVRDLSALVLVEIACEARNKFCTNEYNRLCTSVLPRLVDAWRVEKDAMVRSDLAHGAFMIGDDKTLSSLAPDMIKEQVSPDKLATPSTNSPPSQPKP